MSEKEKEAIVEEQQQDISELLQIRRDKLAALQAEGNNPFFVNTCDKDISAQEIHDRFEELEGKDVCIAGRIMSWRDMGKASFMDIHDRSGRMQVYLKIDEVGEDVYKGLSNWDLGDIAEVGSSKRVFVEDLKESGIPFYRGTEIGALAEGKTVTPELFISKEHYAELCIATGAPNIGDLLMPSICPDGRIWVVNTEKPFYFKDGRVLWVHAIDDSYNPVFLLYTLKDRIMSDYSSIASGTTFAELKIFALKECHVFDVPLELQNQFAAFVNQTDKSKVAIQKALDEAQLLFDSLMQKYFG